MRCSESQIMPTTCSPLQAATQKKKCFFPNFLHKKLLFFSPKKMAFWMFHALLSAPFSTKFFSTCNIFPLSCGWSKAQHNATKHSSFHQKGEGVEIATNYSVEPVVSNVEIIFQHREREKERLTLTVTRALHVGFAVVAFVLGAVLHVPTGVRAAQVILWLLNQILHLILLQVKWLDLIWKSGWKEDPWNLKGFWQKKAPSNIIDSLSTKR